MTDPIAQLPASKKTSKKSPLDILEDVLEDAKNVAKTKQSADSAQEEEQQKEELVQLREQKKAEEAVQIQQQLHKMQEISKTPAQQARKAQDQAGVEERRKIKSDQSGYEIRQLGHKKV
ncbi:hypothetical protein KKE34_03370 [Patescibacteria group bacterium]|nr:hypothetical protein [Patescibacteria group bacterium]MBU1885627.1 hypothetical protein [Patescibacteria group bacterium]